MKYKYIFCHSPPHLELHPQVLLRLQNNAVRASSWVISPFAVALINNLIIADTVLEHH